MSKIIKNAEDYFEEGKRLFNGTKGKPDKTKAIKQWEKAAEMKHPGALYKLGMCCYLGEGVSADREKALKYFGEAAELGSYDAAQFLERVNGKIDEALSESKPKREANSGSDTKADEKSTEQTGSSPFLKISEEDGKYVIRAGSAVAYVSRSDCGFEIKTGSQFLKRDVNFSDAVSQGRQNLEDLCFLKVVPGVSSVLESVKSIQVPYLKDAVSIVYGKAVDIMGAGVNVEEPPKREYPTPVTRREFLSVGMQMYADGDMMQGLAYIKQAAKYGLLDAKELLKSGNIDAEIRARIAAH
ncbi:MAG TPA: tetratricopeptide repeat protein [Methanocorpusculum sp.]|nr:tetratricopeptide repeat protein [Methanocorpusculum sp.]